MRLTKKFVLTACISAAIIMAQMPVAADNGLETLRQTSKAFTSVAKKAVPAVVSVQVEKIVTTGGGYQKNPFEDEFYDFFFGPRSRRRVPQQERKQQGQGSGFIISADGYILTNNHVVGEVDRITVVLNDGRKLDAKLIGTDPDSDVAVIKVEEKDLPFIELGDSDSLQIGEWVIAVGNPFGLNETVTVGVVSAKGRGEVGLTNYEDFIQTDAAINPGNSGGPLLNLNGEAIGINTAIYSQSGGYMGIGFAIPVNMAKQIKDQLINSGKVERGYLGIIMNPQEITPELADLFKLKDNHGVIITGVSEGSPAEKAGLLKDDVIVELDGKKVDNYRTLRNSVSLMAPGTKVKVTVVRNGSRKDVDVKIGSREESGLFVSKEVQKLGMEVADLDADMAKQFGYEPGQGVIITKVTSGSSADRAGLKPGMVILSVNRRYVNSLKEFNAALSQVSGNRVYLLVRSEDVAQYYVLTIE